MKFYITSRHGFLQGSHLEQNSSCPSAEVKCPVIHCARLSRGLRPYITLAVQTYSSGIRVQVLGPDSWGSTPACATLSNGFSSLPLSCLSYKMSIIIVSISLDYLGELGS